MDGNFANQLANALAGALGDSSKFKCSPFSGKEGDDIESFLQKFNLYCDNNNKNDHYKVHNLKMYLDGRAYTLYESLSDEIKNDFALLTETLKTYFAPTRLPSVQAFEKFHSLEMDKDDTVQK